MNFGELKTEIQDTFTRTDSAVTGKIGTWVNRRQKQAAARHNFGFLRRDITTPIADGQSAFNMGGDFKDDVTFFLEKSDSWIELPVRPRLEMIRRYAPDDKGEPQFMSFETWTNTAGSLLLKVYLWPPLSDAAYTIRTVYYQWPTDFIGDSDTSWISVHFPQVLIVGGTAEGYWFLGAEEQARVWEGRWEYELQKAIEHDTKRDLPAEFVLAPRLGVGQTSIRVTDRQLWRI